MIAGDRCKLVSLLGMGGIGKTSLAMILVETIKEQFDHVIWRSLRNAPPVEAILADLISFFADQPISLPEGLDRQLSLLMDYLRKQRCFIILDNAESISGISDAENAAYRLNNVGYRLLIQRIAEERHNSCLLLTSRERFADLVLLEGKKVRSFSLTGLSIEEGQEIFTQAGSLTASKQDWKLIIDHYAGNPLALKIVAAGIRDFLGSNVAKFLDLLQQGNFVFGNINDLLQRQFNRISELEQEVMYWLATVREPVSFEELQSDLVSTQSKQNLLNTLSVLQGRSLIEKVAGSKFTQQPVIMEYAISRFIEEICREITIQTPRLLNQFPLIKAQAKDYIRTAQVRLILKPIADRLAIIFANEDEHELAQKLMDLKHQFYNKSGYFGGNLVNLLSQLSVDLSGYDFSNLVIWQAYLQNQILQNVNFAKSDLSRSVFTETFGSVFCVVFSPDNRLLVSGDTSGDLRIWEVLTGRQLFICKGHTNRIWSVALNPVNSIIASSNSDCTIKLWDLQGRCLNTLIGHTHRIWDVAFSPNGKLLASAGGEGTIKLWDAFTGRCLHTIEAHSKGVRSIVFNSESSILVSSSEDKSIKFWNVNTGGCLRKIDAHDGSIRQLALSLDEQWIASCSEDHTIKFWHWETGKLIKALPTQSSQVWSIAFIPDSNILISADQDGTIKFWDAITEKCFQLLEENTRSSTQAIAVSSDGSMLAGGSNNQTIKLWQVDNGKCLRTLHGYTNWILSASFSPDQKTIVTGSNDETVRIWEFQTGKCLRTLGGHTSPVQIARFSPDGSMIASGSDFGVIKLWSAETGQLIRTMHLHTNPIWNMDFSPSGDKLVSCSSDHTARVWQVQTGQCLQTLIHTTQVWAAEFSPDEQTLASATDDGIIKLWSVATGNCLQTIQGHSGQIWGVSFIEEGTTLISGSQDGTVKTWNVHSGEVLRTVRCGEQMWSLSFSQNGKLIAGDQGAIDAQLWDCITGECIRTLKGHTSWIWSVAFSPDSRILASTSQDETVRLWDIQTGKCTQILRIDRPYERMNITGVRGLTDAQRDTLKALGAVDSAYS